MKQKLALVASSAILVSACGLAIVRGPEDQVLAQAQEIHATAGHRCVKQTETVLCDEGDSKRNPLLISAGPNTVGLATYTDAKATFEKTCAELAPSIASGPKPGGYQIDCAPTKDGVDRLLIIALFPIPEGGMTDADFEAGVAAFMKDADSYVVYLKSHAR
ncbi:hypothetical protein BH09MYX1_BH09MYX1_54750 [soil metagenome]